MPLQGEFFNPFKQFDGSAIPDWLMKRKELSAGPKMLYGRLVRYAGDNGHAFPSERQLAEELGTNARQIRRWLQELREWGLIHIDESDGRVNHYRFKWTCWIDQETERQEAKRARTTEDKSSGVPLGPRTDCPNTEDEMSGVEAAGGPEPRTICPGTPDKLSSEESHEETKHTSTQACTARGSPAAEQFNAYEVPLVAGQDWEFEARRVFNQHKKPICDFIGGRHPTAGELTEFDKRVGTLLENGRTIDTAVVEAGIKDAEAKGYRSVNSLIVGIENIVAPRFKNGQQRNTPTPRQGRPQGLGNGRASGTGSAEEPKPASAINRWAGTPHGSEPPG